MKNMKKETYITPAAESLQLAIENNFTASELNGGARADDAHESDWGSF